MLKELLASAIILPFVRAKKLTEVAAIDRANAIDVTPEPPPILPRTELVAVYEFVEAMMEYAAGDSVKMHWLKLSYDQMAPSRGWPQMTTKALSCRLVYWGCKRVQLDLRANGEGRPTAMRFPLYLVSGKGKQAQTLPKKKKGKPRIAYKNDISHAELLGVVHYDLKTGEFFCRKTGSRMGAVDPKGYVSIALNGTTYRAHRLAWLYAYGRWPHSNIDHADGNRSNNALANLRECDQSQNAANSRIPSHNGSGVKGVTFDKASGKYRARIRASGRLLSLGLYSDLDEAAKAYERAAKHYFGEFARPDRRKK